MPFQRLVGDRAGGIDVAECAEEVAGPAASGAGVVVAAEGEDVLPFSHVNPGFFEELASHGEERGFAGFDFSADSVQLAGLPRRAALADQQDARAVAAEEEAADVFLDV